MNVTITTIPYDQMRYETCGDWLYEGDELHVVVAKLGDWKMEACLAVHELCEAIICRRQGVTQEEVDAFDFAFKGDGEPGDAPDCPYRTAHRVSTGIEFLLALALGVSWTEYEERINAL